MVILALLDTQAILLCIAIMNYFTQREYRIGSYRGVEVLCSILLLQHSENEYLLNTYLSVLKLLSVVNKEMDGI